MTIPTTDLIPVNSPCFGKREREYLMDCLESGWISSGGSYVSRFEAAFAERLGRRFAVAVCNGTAALQVAVDALGLGPGDEVILPSFTIISCVLAILRAGAAPVVVDAEPDTWNMAVSQVEARITPRTKAVMVVHIYGLPTDMQPLLALAALYGLQVIEDAAQGLGIVCDGRPCGSFGTISTLSFYPNKLVTTGEGGMVLTDDTDVAQRCRSLRDLCFRSDRRFVHDTLGWNFRMTALQAAVGLAQVENYESNLQRKKEPGGCFTPRRSRLSAMSDCPRLGPVPRKMSTGSLDLFWRITCPWMPSKSCLAATLTKASKPVRSFGRSTSSRGVARQGACSTANGFR